MRKYSLKQFGVTILAFLLLLNVNVATVYAVAVPDPGKNGSITVIMQDPETGSAVPGGTMTLLQVGNVHEDDGNFSFVLTEEFTESKEPLETPDADLAQRFATYAKGHGISGTTVTIGSNGKVEFANMKPGLYLLVQEQAADGYYAVSPFLVSIPLLENGSYLYDVDATPKMELLSKKPNPPEPTPSPPDLSRQVGQLEEHINEKSPSIPDAFMDTAESTEPKQKQMLAAFYAQIYPEDTEGGFRYYQYTDLTDEAVSRNTEIRYKGRSTTIPAWKRV